MSPTTTAESTPRRAPAMAPDDRRTAIVEATLPLLLENGRMATTREIATAAGIAEGTIFRAFADKDELIAAVVEQAYDIEPLERALSAIDEGLPLRDALEAAIEIMQQRVVDIWRITSAVATHITDRASRPVVDSGALLELFERHRDQLSVDAAVAARLLRALTMSATHPVLVTEPMPPEEIAHLFLHGTARQRTKPRGKK